MHMKPLLFAIFFMIASSANAGGWQAIGDIEHLGAAGKTIRSLSKISNATGNNSHYWHGNTGRINRAGGNARNLPKRKAKLEDVPYLVQESQNIIILMRGTR